MSALTTDEARNQPCPLFRYCANEAGVVQDRDSAIYVHEACKGPDCKIGWRWLPQRGAPAERRGYCGFAGRPE